MFSNEKLHCVNHSQLIIPKLPVTAKYLMQLTFLNISKDFSCINLLQISQKCHHMQFNYQKITLKKWWVSYKQLPKINSFDDNLSA